MGKKSNHERLCQLADEAIDEVYGDTSVSQQETLNSLEAIASKIEDSMATIRSDLAKEDK